MKPQTASRFAAALVATLSIGCTGSDPASDDTSTTTPPTEGVVTSTDESALVGSYLALPEDGIDPPVSVEITADQITYRSTCNSHFGGYQLVDGVLEFDGGATSLVACDEPASMTAVGSVLTDRPSVEISDETVVLTTATQTLILRSDTTAAPVQPIEGRWEIVSVFLGATAQWGTTLATAHVEVGVDEILIDGPCTDGVVSIERSGRDLTVLGSDFAPLPCDEAGAELEDALATIFEPTGVRDFTIVTTTRGVDLVPAVAPPEDQLDPAGLSLRPDPSAPTSLGDAAPLANAMSATSNGTVSVVPEAAHSTADSRQLRCSWERPSAARGGLRTVGPRRILRTAATYCS